MNVHTCIKTHNKAILNTRCEWYSKWFMLLFCFLEKQWQYWFLLHGEVNKRFYYKNVKINADFCLETLWYIRRMMELAGEYCGVSTSLSENSDSWALFSMSILSWLLFAERVAFVHFLEVIFTGYSGNYPSFWLLFRVRRVHSCRNQ